MPNSLWNACKLISTDLFGIQPRSWNYVLTTHPSRVYLVNTNHSICQMTFSCQLKLPAITFHTANRLIECNLKHKAKLKIDKKSFPCFWKLHSFSFWGALYFLIILLMSQMLITLLYSFVVLREDTINHISYINTKTGSSGYNKSASKRPLVLLILHICSMDFVRLIEALNVILCKLI